MEKISLLFNADFDKKLSSGKYHQFESSKINQEFEYLIHWLHPEGTLFSTKNYQGIYRDYLKQQTGENLKTICTGVPELFCQNFKEPELLKKLQNKISLFDYLKEKEMIKHRGIRISRSEDIEDGFLYKTPYGMSGSGHYSGIQNKIAIEKALKKYGEVLKEELLSRSLDFSTLCHEGKIITQYENIVDERFQYKGSFFKPDFKLGSGLDEFYEKTINQVLEYSSDYKGVMAIDGFSYQAHSRVHGACEINTRKTMGYFAYELWKKYYESSHYFKFLLFKNNFKAKLLNTFFDENLLEGVKLISPIENNFLIFTVAADTEVEIKTRELGLYTTLFEN